MRVLSREQVRELDRRASDEYGVPSIVLMENAGRGIVDVLHGLGVAGQVVICCGQGNNGGDGLVIARHLDNAGYAVRVLLAVPEDRLRGDAAVNCRIVRASGIPLIASDDPERWLAEMAGAQWVIDALLGTGARGEPRPPLDALIEAINTVGPRATVLAVDLPSGLDCDTGRPARQTVRAAHTCTMVAAKSGFLAPEAAEFLGTLHLVDIGAPRKLVEQMLAASPV